MIVTVQSALKSNLLFGFDTESMRVVPAPDNQPTINFRWEAIEEKLLANTAAKDIPVNSSDGGSKKRSS
jgi:hypothetical protein